MDFRVGQGFDVHPFAEGRELWLAGVQIDHPCGLQGHSDADVMSHALCDALLGAANLGDLGQHFPDDDPEWKGAKGLDLLHAVGQILTGAGWVVGNADITLLGEEPKIAPFKDAMRENMAGVLDLEASHVSIKATTLERLGPLGRGEGLAAMALVLIRRGE